MPTSLLQYEMLPTTWFAISSLMIVAVFFRFNRFWSVRNLDILGLILSAPGLLYIAMGSSASDPQSGTGYLWLTLFGCVVFVRLILDTMMVRRPLLEPNLSSSALTFSCIMLILFMIANIVVNRGNAIETPRTLRLEQILSMRKEFGNEPIAQYKDKPGYVPFMRFSEFTNRSFSPSESFWKTFFLEKPEKSSSSEAKSAGSKERVFVPLFRQNSGFLNPQDSFEKILLMSLILFIQIGIVAGMIFIGHCHFGNIKTGIAAAFFYLQLLYVVQFPSSLIHIVPACLIVLAVLFYRRPVVSGLLIGTAGSLVFYPFFLIPLWASFYWKKGVIRFLFGSASAILAMALLLMFSPSLGGDYGEQIALMFGYRSIRVPLPDGIWAFCPTIYRIPVMALFGGVCLGLVLWPVRKNLATLISSSALIMLGVQFWMGNYGGLYMAWYLPLLILIIFRPNLEDRIAASTVVDI
ncbi:MAG: hypothetical protein Q4G69_03140 [Planctomycetia bacterium]|nr:hypothetical protein [Planctomycetia bacterium]